MINLPSVFCAKGQVIPHGSVMKDRSRYPMVRSSLNLGVNKSHFEPHQSASSLDPRIVGHLQRRINDLSNMETRHRYMIVPDIDRKPSETASIQEHTFDPNKSHVSTSVNDHFIDDLAHNQRSARGSFRGERPPSSSVKSIEFNMRNLKRTMAEKQKRNKDYGSKRVTDYHDTRQGVSAPMKDAKHAYFTSYPKASLYGGDMMNRSEEKLNSFERSQFQSTYGASSHKP